MKTGLFFGSFNPIHIGHLIIANYMLEFTDLEEIWFVVSPLSPFKQEKELIEDHHRLKMVKLAIENTKGYKACDIEFTLPKPSYTFRTLEFLKKKYPNRNFVIILGGDNILSFSKWKKNKWISENFQIYVYSRPGFEHFSQIKNVFSFKAPLLEISATQIRKALAQGKNMIFFLHPNVYKYIKDNDLYS